MTQRNPGPAMTIAEWCMFAAVLLYLLTLAPIKVLGYREFNNKKPREPDFYKDPMRARVLRRATSTASKRFHFSAWPSFSRNFAVRLNHGSIPSPSRSSYCDSAM